MAGIARNIELYNSAYRLAWKHVSEVQKREKPNIAWRLHDFIRREIKKGASEPLLIASEALRSVEFKKLGIKDRRSIRRELGSKSKIQKAPPATRATAHCEVNDAKLVLVSARKCGSRGQPPPPFPRLAPGKGALSPPPGQQSALRDCSPPVHLTLHVLERRRQFGNTAFGQFCTQAQLQIRSVHALQLPVVAINGSRGFIRPKRSVSAALDCHLVSICCK